MKEKFLVILLFLSFMASPWFLTYSQEKIIIFVKPLEAKNVSESLVSTAISIFKQELTATGRFNLVSEEQWKNVAEANGIVMKSRTLFDRDEDQKIGNFVRAKKIITGSIEQSGTGFLMTIDWVDLEKGFTERTITETMDSEYQLEKSVKKIIAEIEKMFIAGGKVISTNDEQVRIRMDLKDSGWQVGTVFELKRISGQAYGKVKIEKIDGLEAVGTAYELQDFIHINDRVEVAGMQKQTGKIRPNVGLVNFEADENIIAQDLLDKLYIKCQTNLTNCNRFNLYDARTVAAIISGKSDIELDYYIDGEILEDRLYDGYTVTLRIKEFDTDMIHTQETEKCLRRDVEKTVEVLLNSIVSKFPITGKVTRIEQKEITVNLGAAHNIKEKDLLQFKSRENKILLADAKVWKVYRDYFTVKQNEKYRNVRLGTLVEMAENKKLEDRYQEERERLKRSYIKNKEIVDRMTNEKLKSEEEQKRRQEEAKKKAEEKRLAAERKKQEQEYARTMPKSRIKLSLGKLLFEDEATENLYNSNKTGKFNVSLYLGNHPNFNISVSYQYGYFDDNTITGKSQKSYIAEQALGLGARVQIKLPFLFSTAIMPYIEGSGRRCMFESKLKPESKIPNNIVKWSGYYVAADGGIEFVFDQNFSIFAQAGLNRKLKLESDKLKFEYFFIDGGVAIWF